METAHEYFVAVIEAILETVEALEADGIEVSVESILTHAAERAESGHDENYPAHLQGYMSDAQYAYELLACDPKSRDILEQQTIDEIRRDYTEYTNTNKWRA